MLVDYTTLCNPFYMSNDEDLIGTAEAARILDMERSVFARKVNSGALDLEIAMRASGTNGEKFYRRSDVEALAPPLKAAG